MKSIIEHLLNYTLECEGPFQRLSPSNKEYAAEVKLENPLNDAQKQLLDAFLELSSNRHCHGKKYYDDDKPKSVQKTAFGLVRIILLWLSVFEAYESKNPVG